MASREHVDGSSPLVSFIVPNYNHARFLGDAIESALAQTYPNHEVIVVDDGSTDDSPAVGAAYGDRIRYIRQVNQGLSAARNTGIAAARGEYIALLDADDLIEPTYLERMLAASHSKPGLAGAYCGYRYVDQENKALPQVENRVLPMVELYSALRDGNFFVPESVLALKSCYDTCGPYDTALKSCEDWDLWLCMTQRYEFAGISDVLIRYRVVLGSMSSNPGRMLANRLAVLGKHIGPEPTTSQWSGSVQQRAYALAYFRAVIEYLQNGDLEQSYAALKQVARLDGSRLADISTQYEMACGQQPKGLRGQGVQLDINEADRALRATLARVVNEPDLQAMLKPRWRTIEASEHTALALLAYNTGAAKAAKDHALKALQLEPQRLLQPDFAAMMARNTLGAGTITRLKRGV